MPIGLGKNSKKKCHILQKNFDICMVINNNIEQCDFYRKVLAICLKRPKKIFRSGP